MNTSKHIAIIGGGIAGLCTAYWLKKEGLNVTVYEKSDEPGGAIRTIKEHGYLVELGPNSALETSEVLKDLIKELGIEDQKIYGSEESNKRYIVKNGKLEAIPLGILNFLKTGLWSWKAKLRLLKEPFIKPSTDKNISLAQLVEHRLGREFLDYAINPFVAGVYAGDPKTLSSAAGFPKLYNLEQKYGSFIKGAFLGARERRKRKEVAKDRAKMFSFIEGMQTFPKALARYLGEDIQYDTFIEHILPVNEKFKVTAVENGHSTTSVFDGVVVCTPTHISAQLLLDMDPEASDHLRKVYHPPVTVVYTGFHRKDIHRKLDGFGFLIPELERRKILGTLWNSSIFPGRVPAKQVAFTTFVGGTRQPEIALLEDDTIKDIVVDELKDLIGLEGKPVYVKIKKWKKAIPQYTIGYQKTQESINMLEEKFNGLYFAGNFRRGISVGDSVLSAFETFSKIKNNIALSTFSA